MANSAEQYVQLQLGALMIQSADLRAALDKANERIAALEKENAEWEATKSPGTPANT